MLYRVLEQDDYYFILNWS